MHYLQKLKTLLLLLFVAVTAKAQISNGKVYNFVNVAYNTQSLAITSGEYITIVPTNQDGSEQLWYAEGNETDGYTLRSLCSGYYLRSSNGQSSKWTMVSTPDANCKLKCHTVGSNYTFRATNTTNDWHSMHLATSQGSHLVGWTSSASATQWIINEVSVAPERLTALLDKADEVAGAVNNVTTYQSALNNLFSDKACTQLKKSFASESAVTSDADYLALPATLQQMVLKVYKDSWVENNYDNSKPAWDTDYAKKYRVQFYEPYNEPMCASEALGLNWHTNMNNPTGIFANVQDVLYVMVEGTIKDGAHLYLASCKGHNKLGGYNEGVQLHEGLNVIPSFEEGCNYFINYVVETFDTSNGRRGHQAKVRSLSQFPDLKIHIEGGYINGYWNKMGDYNQTGSNVLYAPDKNTDWDYIAARATQTDVTVLGEYITLQFPLHEATNSEGGTEQGLDYYYTGKNIIESSINEWDNVMMWERILLGVLSQETTENASKNPKSPYSSSPNVVSYTGNDSEFPTGYGDYYNVHGLSFGTPSGYMYGSGDHCGYHYNTMQSIMVEILTSAGSHWGPAHEIGHQHQGLLNMRGLTEVTNNLFSNVVYWYFGETTSRVNGTEGSLSNVLAAYNAEGSDFFTNNIWAQTHMYYKMFLYYHVLGHNPKFYPRLFEMLRQDPMTIEYNQSGAKSLLHFYKKCCYAAGDDLTEFFRAYGFFRVMKDRFVGDYSNAVYNQTQEEIDAAIKEIKDWAKANDEVKENISVLFINDDTNDEILSHKGDVLTQYDAANSAVVGSYATFADASNDAADYECSVSGNTATMNGNGGVGYAIFNEKGEIVAFSDKPDFAVSSECAAAIAQGEVTMKAVNADNTVEVVELDDEAATKYGLLGTLLEEAAVWLSLIDDSGTKVGYYKTEFTELQKAYNDANEVYTNKVADSYSAAYAMLLEACNEVKNNTYDRINIIDGYAYRLENKRHSGNSMTVNDSWDVTASANNDSEAKQQWVFEATDEAGVYLIKNKDISSKGDYGYLGELKNDTRIIANATREEAKGYMPISVGPGIWALRCQTGDKKSLNYNTGKGVLGWDHNGDEASYWYITAVGKDATVEKLYELQTLVTKTENLIDEVGYANKVKLQGTNEKAEFYLYCNALYNKSANSNENDNCKNTEKLLDGDPNTHLHTDNSTSESGYKADDDLDHYLRVDMGAKNKISKFKFTYTTRNAGSWHNHPKTIVIEGCNSLTQEEFSPITTITDLQDKTSWTYTSQEIECTPYRYIRFMVTDTHSNSSSNYKSWGNHPYFYMAEFNLITEEVVQVDEEYKNTISEDLLRDVYSAVMDAKDVLVAESTGDDYTTAFEALTTKYGNLLAARNNADNAALDALRGQLGTLITEVDDLYKSCGSVVPVDAVANTEVTGLQAAYQNVDYYVWTNAQSTQEGPISGLIDGLYGTGYTDKPYYFHSAYSGETITDGLKHHITINLGTNNAVSAFKFQYRNRTNAGVGFPAEIEVYGSIDGSSYNKIITLNDMETNATTVYTSPVIETSKGYAYLRFMVTKSSGNKSYFHMAEFDLYIGEPADYDVQLNGNQGGVDNEMMIATYEAVVAARASKDMATSEAQLQKAIEKLQVQKEAFENAKVVAVGYNVVVVGGNGNGGVVYGKEYKHGETFEAAPGLTETDFTAIPLASYTDGVITMNGTTITVTYNKVYTVEVIGADGGVSYNGGAEVKHNGTIIVPQNIDETQLRASTVTGYNSVVEVNHENGTICVTYTLDRTELENLIGETNELMQACQVFVNSAYVTNELMISTSNAIGTAQDKLEEEDLTYAEYTEAVAALQTAYGTLNTAKGNAENEVAARNQLKEQLIALIGETETLIASCYENDELKYVNSDYVTEISIAEIRSAIETAQAKCNSNGTTESEYNASLGTLGQMTDDLATAIENANNEAAARDGKRAELNALIDAANELITLCGTTPGDATESLINEVSTAVTSAQEVASNMGSTVDALTTATETLQSQYDVLSAARQSTAKTELRALIAQTEALIAECGNIALSPTTESEGVVTLQTEDPNAPFYLSTNATENNEGAIGNLLKDGDDYFHSAWSYAVGEAHYLQVDMGEVHALKEFVFSYTTKNNLRSPYPTEIVVSGSNDGVSFKQLDLFNEGLPTTASTSCDIRVSLNRSYRYLRFVVTKSAAEGVNCKPRDEFYCFAISKFGITEYPANESYYVESLNPNGSVTEEQLLNVFDAKNEATEFAANSYNESELNSKKTELKALYDALLLANNTNLLPIVFTTNMENPVLYTLKSKRGDTKTLQYDPAANHMFGIAEKSDANVKQMFYFTIGDERTKVYVHPFAAGEQVLAASNTGDGAAKVFAKEKGELRYEQWTIVEVKVNEVVWYNLRPAGTSTNFSNYGGGSAKMGFYGTSNDDGSLFQFIEVDESTIDGSSAYHSLKVYYDEVTKVKSSDITGSSNVGYYPENEAIAYNSAYANAAELLNGTSDYDNYLATYKALLSANEALVINMPKEGAYYTIVSACNDHRNGQLMYATGDNSIVFSREMTNVKPEALWKFTSEGYLENFQTGCCVSTESTGGGHHKLGEAPRVVAIKSISLDGQVLLTPSGAQPLHAQDNGSVVVGWGAYDAGSASAWRIVEVEDMSLVKFAVSISQYEHAGLYLNYPVSIPDNVKAYYLDGSKISIDNEGVGTLNLTKIEDEVIPARTAVILYTPHGDQTIPYYFRYAEEPIGKEYTNLFTGSTYQTYREAEANHYYYVFGQNNGEIGLYKNGVKYKYNDEGAIEEVKEGATHYKMSANKILLDWNNNTTAIMVKSFRFRLGTGGQTTSLEDALIMENAIIYDLYGRRIPEVKTSGLYIINGEKHYIHVK